MQEFLLMQAAPTGVEQFIGAQRPAREQRLEKLKLGIPTSEGGGCRRMIDPLADCHRPALRCRGQKVSKVQRGQLRVSSSDGKIPINQGMWGFQEDNDRSGATERWTSTSRLFVSVRR